MNKIGKKLFQAWLCSKSGRRYASQEEMAIKLEIGALLVLSPIAFFVTSITLERITLIGSLTIILIVELLNTAIEAAVDRVGKESHELSKKAKDIGSAAVFVSICLAVYIWASLIIL